MLFFCEKTNLAHTFRMQQEVCEKNHYAPLQFFIKVWETQAFLFGMRNCSPGDPPMQFMFATNIYLSLIHI